MIFVDTNYFIRFLINDIPLQFKKARELFELGAKDKIQLFTSTIVIFEIYWLMFKFYEKSRSESILILKNILSMNFVYLEERDILFEALKIYEDGSLELEDCYNIAFAKANKMLDFKTFDKKLLNYLKRIG